MKKLIKILIFAIMTCFLVVSVSAEMNRNISINQTGNYTKNTSFIFDHDKRDFVDVHIRPAYIMLTSGQTIAKYVVTIVDKHDKRARKECDSKRDQCKLTKNSPLNATEEKYQYNINIATKIPFKVDYPTSIDLMSGEKKTFELTIDTLVMSSNSTINWTNRTSRVYKFKVNVAQNGANTSLPRDSATATLHLIKPKIRNPNQHSKKDELNNLKDKMKDERKETKLDNKEELKNMKDKIKDAKNNQTK